MLTVKFMVGLHLELERPPQKLPRTHVLTTKHVLWRCPLQDLVKNDDAQSTFIIRKSFRQLKKAFAESLELHSSGEKSLKNLRCASSLLVGSMVRHSDPQGTYRSLTAIVTEFSKQLKGYEGVVCQCHNCVRIYYLFIVPQVADFVLGKLFWQSDQAQSVVHFLLHSGPPAEH